MYSPETETIRSYKLESELLTSVFEAVINQSQVSNVDESFLSNNPKIKRLDITLEHSLTKMCLLKKQCLVIQDLKKDADYSQIDDFSSLQGLTSRDMGGGCVMTPILIQGKPIGLIREYYYDKVGQIPHPDVIRNIGENLQSTMQASTIFDNLQRKALAIRNRYYLKAVLIINFIESRE